MNIQHSYPVLVQFNIITVIRVTECFIYGTGIAELKSVALAWGQNLSGININNMVEPFEIQRFPPEATFVKIREGLSEK
jgi:hypothetical protein